MGMTFSHLLPGTTGFAATVVAQWYSVDPGLIPIAIVLLLSLILLGVAVAIFQRSIKQKGKQDPAAESQMLQTLEQAIEKGRASLDIDVQVPPVMHEEIPSPLTELALQFDNALPEPRPEAKSEHDQIAQSALNGANGANGTNFNGFAQPPANPARMGTAHVSLPRLSELRGMRFSQALRDLDRTKRSAPPSADPYSLEGSLSGALDYELDDAHDDPINEILMSAIAPFEPMFAPTASAPEAQNGAQGPPSLQMIFPAKPAPVKSREHRGEDSARSPREPKAPGKETEGFLDQLHILPSRRGQYKKKG